MREFDLPLSEKEIAEARRKAEREAAEKVEQELEEKEYEATAGGGVVKAVISGKKTLKSVTIDPEAVDPEDVEMLQDLVVAAGNEALR